MRGCHEHEETRQVGLVLRFLLPSSMVVALAESRGTLVVTTARAANALLRVPEKGAILVPPALEFEFRMRVQVGAPLDQGTWDGQRRRIMPIIGGTFEGPRFSGTILPGGADWQSVRMTDGVARINARCTPRHDDGTQITRCRRTGAPSP